MYYRHVSSCFSPREACYWQISVCELFVFRAQTVTFLTCQSSAVCFPPSVFWCARRRVSSCLRWHSDCDDSNLRIHTDTLRGKGQGFIGRLTSPWCLVIGYLADASFHALRLQCTYPTGNALLKATVVVGQLSRSSFALSGTYCTTLGFPSGAQICNELKESWLSTGRGLLSI